MRPCQPFGSVIEIPSRRSFVVVVASAFDEGEANAAAASTNTHQAKRQRPTTTSTAELSAPVHHQRVASVPQRELRNVSSGRWDVSRFRQNATFPCRAEDLASEGGCRR